MPMLADIDDPPRSRTRGLLIGALVAVPIAAVFVGVFVPSLVGAILGGSRSFDDRLRQEDGYMQAVCAQMSLPRDEALCECVLAVEYPALDCQAPFAAWSVARQQEHCAAPDDEKAALSFCACVGAVAEQIAAAEDDEGREREAQAYRRCQELPDVVELPPVEALAGAASR
ncbi:MAG: hypothetical protein KDK70_40135 [Myxococcales bacterium]|nr:hypothetical protein [Myxococcales bacterium]